jgi:DNA-directed RNA polymerase subunit omega
MQELKTNRLQLGENLMPEDRLNRVLDQLYPRDLAETGVSSE